MNKAEELLESVKSLTESYGKGHYITHDGRPISGPHSNGHDAHHERQEYDDWHKTTEHVFHDGKGNWHHSDEYGRHTSPAKMHKSITNHAK